MRREYPIVGSYCRVIQDVPRDGDGLVMTFFQPQTFVATANIPSGIIPSGNNVRIIEYYPPDFVVVEPLPPRE